MPSPWSDEAPEWAPTITTFGEINMSNDEDVCKNCGDSDPWHDCIYVQCDEPTCNALRSPVTLGQFVEACEHWQKHTYLYGCSHGR